MKDLRTLIAQSIIEASRADVSGLRSFLKSNPGEPLLATGSGAAETVADFAALLYGARGGVGTAMSPYTFNSISDEALRTSKVLLVSKGGHNNDIVFATKRSLEVNPEKTASFTLYEGERNEVSKAFAKAGRSGRSFDIPVRAEDGFVSVGTPVAYFALLCKAFLPEVDLERFAKPQKSWRAIHNDGSELGLQELKGVSNFVILHGGWGRPVAANIEGKLTESGLAGASVYDYRNYCHGRFIYTSNHLEDSAVVMLISPRERDIAERTRKFLPAGTKLVLIETGEESAAAALDLLVRSTGFIFDLCEEAGVNLESPANPGKIDKRVPMWVPFMAGMKKAGPLSLR